MADGFPTLTETALGAFLHDTGKFWQRAHGAQRNADPEVQQVAEYALPKTADGRPSHIHALWTWQFFHWLEKENLSLPGVNRDRVRNLAGYHHRPGGGPAEEAGAQWLIAEADQLAAGMDRAARQDDDMEQNGAWDQFIRTPMISPFSSVFLGKELGEVPKMLLPLDRLAPEAELDPAESLDTSAWQDRYRHLLARFQQEFRALSRLRSAWLFQSSLKSLCERYWHAVPSSTKDQPDVSLYDHSRAVAAIASALYQWHAANGGITKESLEAAREENRFVWLLGDLSGIQSALFRLQHQQVRGVARILRARSFLMSLITESAALDLLWRLGLTPFSLVQNAGGRFLILAGNVPQTRQALEAVRRDVEQWMLERWNGELGLHLSITAPFSGELFRRERFHEMSALWSEAAEQSKQRPFSTCYQPVLRQERFEFGACPACGIRAARAEGGGEEAYCGPCAEERRLGGDLPRLHAIGWSRQSIGDPEKNLRLWNGLHLHWHVRGVDPGVLEEGFLTGPALDPQLPLALRHTGHYVPLLEEEEFEKLPYAKHLSEDARQTRPGETKTFEHIALDALEVVNGRIYGEDLLAVIKADVDRLGAIFSQGVQRPSLGLVAGLSRMLDFFFAARLPHLLRTDPRFRSTYVVYAGGDDLLLIGPWRQSLELLGKLQEAFARYVGSPQITLSAALELVHPDEPLNRSVSAAEERLERAKNAGRNRVCAVDEDPLPWDQFRRQLDYAEKLLDWMRQGELSQGFVYRMLAFDRDRMACERDRADANAASWRARWGYQLRRNLKIENLASSPLAQFLNSLFGLNAQFGKAARPPSARTAISVAVYRNRSF